MTPSPYTIPFKSAHLRATIVKILLIVGATASAVSLITEALSIPFPFNPDQEPDPNVLGAVLALAIALLIVFQFIINVTTVVFFCVWLYRSYDNLRVFNRWTSLDYSPGMAVGSFFIPFVSLVVPYRAVREVWQKSAIAEEIMLGLSDPPASFPLWWMFWLIYCIAGRIAFRFSFNADVPHTTAAIASIGGGALFTLAAVFAFLVVDGIDRRQEDTAERLQLGNFARPQPPPANLYSEPVTNESSFSGQ